MAAPGPVELRGTRLPARLADLKRPPECLYVRGELPRGPAVALVGTRHPSAEAERFAERLAKELGHAGVAILSGGARGIDTAAHRGALSAGATTVVVAPAGFQRPFPDSNRELFQRIVDVGGAYLSLVPDDQAPKNPAFFARNACLAALAHVLVVVEAPFRSGSRNAARWARALGRPVLAVPAAPWHEKGAGTLLELRLGAGLCVRARDVLDELERVLLHPLPSPPPSERPAAGEPLGAPTQATLPFVEGLAPAGGVAIVLSAITGGATNLDRICEQTGLPAATVQKHVLTLTLEGVLAPDPSGRLLRWPDQRPVSVVKLRK